MGCGQDAFKGIAHQTDVAQIKIARVPHPAVNSIFGLNDQERAGFRIEIPEKISSFTLKCETPGQTCRNKLMFRN